MPDKAIDNKNKKRGLKVAAIAGGLVLVGGVAFAYWTQGGSGTGSASTGTTQAITVNQVDPVTNLAPGSGAQPLQGNFDNPNSGPVYVAKVAVAISSVDSTGTCDASDYTLSATEVAVGHEIAAGNGVDSWGPVTIAFNDKPGVNQDGCKGATVNLAYTAS